MSTPAFHKHLSITNFTAFKEVSLDFVAGVNAFIGENGSGKTHLLKALYAAQLTQSRQQRSVGDTLSGLFQTRELAPLIRMGTSSSTFAEVKGRYGTEEWMYTIRRDQDTKWMVTEMPLQRVERPIFIPAIDMMGHTRGFLQAANEVVLDFDLTCTDIVTLMGLERRNGTEPVNALEGLSKLLGGKIEFEESTGRFYLVSTKGRLPMPLVAEGLRKVATLVRLAQNGWLTPGATLFWDEPEANMNPVLMDDIIAAALTLARRGIQVFLTTHSYVILKELELQSTPDDEVRYFSLQNTKSGTKVTTADELAALEPNSILRQYASLYDRDLDRALGKGRRHASL